jgi:hypothetical protein
MVMTLHHYDPAALDTFALRLLDIASVIRQMANQTREYGISDVVLHDQKALEWCGKLERWAHKTHADIELRILQEKAERRASTAKQSL